MYPVQPWFADILITKYSAPETVPSVVSPLKVHVFVAPPESMVASKSPERHPSPSLVFPDPSEGFPRSRNPDFPGMATSTKTFLLDPSVPWFAPVFPTIVASPFMTIETLGLSFVVLFKNQ